MTSHRHRVAATLGIFGVILIAVACGTGPTTAPAASVTARVVATHLRGKRYCEVLLVRAGLAGLSADVYNSYGLNDCPQSRWATLDADKIADDNGALTAVLSGPRYWLVDSIAKDGAAGQTTTFGGIAMRKDATVDIGNPVTAARPYTPHLVNRGTEFNFDAGRQVYELVEPNGTRWVMQSWSQKTDPTLSPADLPGLASRLTPPAGWKYDVRTLSVPLHVLTTTTSAYVLQDNLNNSYSRQNST
ncbi:MAG: hypothetical protein VYA67_13630 [Actinomycetota bacterium]|jgi:hypothetical protein|uniref:Lipoprotein n=1 Tax=Mycobacterium lentiflavum TaxID=141349 RepID=A0ABY3UVN8_MYCLN|nr:hypothetical protein [Mycobacterium lentiflavum]MEE3064977.1 hypothetical protein [Actinomycetota bacterium]ULP41202.1 hypothetical protein MJO58_20255 [Mycobacterium lentiflavum]